MRCQLRCQVFCPSIFYTHSYLEYRVNLKSSGNNALRCHPKNDGGANPEIGRGGPNNGKHLRPKDLSVAPVAGKALLKGFCYGVILFMGLVDFNRVLISTQSTN